VVSAFVVKGRKARHQRRHRESRWARHCGPQLSTVNKLAQGLPTGGAAAVIAVAGGGGYAARASRSGGACGGYGGVVRRYACGGGGLRRRRCGDAVAIATTGNAPQRLAAFLTDHKGHRRRTFSTRRSRFKTTKRMRHRQEPIPLFRVLSDFERRYSYSIAHRAI